MEKENVAETKALTPGEKYRASKKIEEEKKEKVYTVGDIINIYQALEDLSTMPQIVRNGQVFRTIAGVKGIGGKIGYNINKNLDFLRSSKRSYDKEQNDYINEHGEKNKAGVVSIIKDMPDAKDKENFAKIQALNAKAMQNLIDYMNEIAKEKEKLPEMRSLLISTQNGIPCWSENIPASILRPLQEAGIIVDELEEKKKG